MGKIWEVLSSVVVEVPLFLYMLCLYYQIPAQNSLFLYKVCLTVCKYDQNLCNQLVAAKFNVTQTYEHNVSSETTRWMFYATILSTIPSFITTTIMGAYADRKGHKLPILLPFFGFIFASGYQLCMAKFTNVHVGYMLIGPLIHGMSGGFASVTMAGYSYLTSLSTERYRTIRITVLEGCMSAGSVIGSFTLGLVLDNTKDPYTGWRNTYITAISLCVVAILFILIQARRIGLHSVSEESRLGALKNSINPKETCTVICSNFPSVLHLTLTASFTLWVTGLGKFDVLFSYIQRMQLNRSFYGYFTGFGAGLQALAGIVIVNVVKRKYYWQDTTVALLGMISGLLSALILGVSGFMQPGSSSFQALFWTSPVAEMFQIVAPPSIRSIASHLVSPVDQGKLFSFITGMDGLLQLLTSAIYQYGLWPHTEKDFPSASFFVSAALTTISIFITCCIRNVLNRRRQYTEQRQLLEDDIHS